MANRHPKWLEEFAMSTDNHYFVEKNENGKFAVRAKGSDRASGLFETQAEAIARVKELNPADHPDVERVRETETGGPDKWRKA
jgi:uncharacterized protein YdaT